MIRFLAAIFLWLVSYPVFAQSAVTLEQFGGGCGYATDNTAAMFGATNSYRAYIAANGPTKLQLRSCDYWFQTPGVAAFDTIAPHIEGGGRFASRLILNFDLASGQPFIGAYGVKGTIVRDLAIVRTTGALGVMLAVRSSPALDASHYSISDILITTSLPSPAAPCGCTFERGLEINGQERGAFGVRTGNINNVHIFGIATDTSVLIEAAIGLSWQGGGVYQGGMRLGQFGVSGKNNYLSIALSNVNGPINVRQCIDCNVGVPLISGAVLNTSEAVFTWVRGRAAGGAESNWISSGLVAY